MLVANLQRDLLSHAKVSGSSPHVCSNTLAVLSSLLAAGTQAEANTPSLEWINRPAAKYSCYLSFQVLYSSPDCFLPAPPITTTYDFAPLLSPPQVCFSLFSTFFSIHLTHSYLSNSTLAAAAPESIRVD